MEQEGRDPSRDPQHDRTGGSVINDEQHAQETVGASKVSKFPKERKSNLVFRKSTTESSGKGHSGIK